MALIPITKQVHDYVITILCDNWTIVKLPIHQPTETPMFDMLRNYGVFTKLGYVSNQYNHIWMMQDISHAHFPAHNGINTPSNECG